MSKTHPDLKKEVIRTHIKNRSREPFKAVLTNVLSAAPTESAIKSWARSKPDKWGQLVNTMSRLCEYTEKTEGDTQNIYIQINSMPDSVLRHQIEETRRKLQEMGGAIFEAPSHDDALQVEGKCLTDPHSAGSTDVHSAGSDDLGEKKNGD